MMPPVVELLRHNPRHTNGIGIGHGRAACLGTARSCAACSPGVHRLLQDRPHSEAAQYRYHNAHRGQQHLIQCAETLEILECQYLSSRVHACIKLINVRAGARGGRHAPPSNDPVPIQNRGRNKGPRRKAAATLATTCRPGVSFEWLLVVLQGTRFWRPDRRSAFGLTGWHEHGRGERGVRMSVIFNHYIL